MILTAISKPEINKTTAKGTILAKDTKPPAINIFQVKPAKIANNK